MILSVLYVIKNCRPMNIKFHGSTKKNGIQLILMKPQKMNFYGKNSAQNIGFQCTTCVSKKEKN